MKVVEPTAAAEQNVLRRLTVKDKVLVQMGEHLCEPDLAEYPFELTQKGLSECLGTRRSHIAASMKGLLEDRLIELRKGHIEGETRQQNAYLLTSQGLERAKGLKETIVSEVVEFDKDGEVRKLTIAEVLKTTNLSLASIFKQLDHGGPLKDERTVVTKPGPQLIQIYCPTCRRNFEVENIYGDEEAGFDCPGCARPYRVVPVEKEVFDDKRAPAIGMTRAQLFAVVSTIIIALIIIEARLVRPQLLANLFFAVFFFAIPVILLVGFFGFRRPKKAPRRVVVVSGVISTMLVLGLIMVQVWDILIIRVDFEIQTTISLMLAVALALGYLGTRTMSSQTRGEYLLVAGLTLLLVAIALPFLRKIEGLTMESVPFVGVIGTTVVILSSFHYVNRETQLLDLLLTGGVIIVFVSVVQLLPERANVLDDISIASLILLGLFMVSLRFIQIKASVSVGNQFLAAATLSVGLLFAVLGAFMIWGNSPIAGLAEILLVSPFIFLGIKEVFNSEWMYRVPIVVYLSFVEVLVLTDAFLT